MPINRGSHLSAVIEEVKFLKPNSILDVGVGFGMMGVIFRAYTDIRMSELEPGRYHNWKALIDGVEVHSYYRNQAWYLYDNVFEEDAIRFMDTSEHYDLVYCGDMIEHLSKEDGHKLIQKMLKVGNHVILATPSPAPTQGELLGNKHEEHLSSWDEKDFSDYTHRVVGNLGGILVVVLWNKAS